MSMRAKKSSIFKSAVANLKETLADLPDARVGDNVFIKMKDIGLGAFSVFFTQCASFLEHQKLMKRRQGKNNAHSLFHIDHIASDNHIRQLLDHVPPSALDSVYKHCLAQLEQAGIVDNFRSFSEQVLIAVDGLQYFASNKISCEKCSYKEHKNGSTSFSHSMVSATMVKPGCATVLPLCSEFIENKDGEKKQDCERAAIKRWLSKHGENYSKLGATLLGDDLYCCQSICSEVLDAGFNFIFTCKETSHKWLYDYVNGLFQAGNLVVEEHFLTEKKKQYSYRCRYANNVPLRDTDDALLVNWCDVEVFNSKGVRVYRGAFASNHTITALNVLDVIQAGRTRWKIENEHNNTLKNHGYHLQHNFGHGNHNLAAVLTTLILLSFLFHSMLALLDNHYKAIRGYLPRYMFFQQVRTLLFYTYFASWNALMECMVDACEIEVHDDG